MPADSGEWNVGETVRFGYYSQEGIEFDDNKRVIDAITEIAEDIVVNGDVRYTPMQFHPLPLLAYRPADGISTPSAAANAPAFTLRLC